MFAIALLSVCFYAIVSCTYVLISILFMKQEKQGYHGYIPRIYESQLYDVRLENQLNLLAHGYEDPEVSSRQNERSLEKKRCRPQRLLQ